MTILEKVDWNELLRRTKQGDDQARARATTELLDHLDVRLGENLPCRLQRLNCRANPETLLQKTLDIIKRKLADGQIRDNPDLYGFGVLRRVIADALKREKSVFIDSLPFGDLDATGNPRIDSETQIVDQIFWKKVRDAILQMDDFCRTFFLGAWEGRSRKEIWDLFPGMKRQAFDTRSCRCRQRLKAILGE